MGDADLSVAKVSVWWDIENCAVPANLDPHRIAQNVSSALRLANFNGPVTIDVFGDTNSLDQGTIAALSSTGINLNHVPRGNKDAADKAILVAMLFWALDNPPPAHFLLISGDADFANALHRLRMKRYNVLLARPDVHVKPALFGAAKDVWYWTSLAKGQLSVSRTHESLEEPLHSQKNISNGSTREYRASGNGSHCASGSVTSERPSVQTFVPSSASGSFSGEDLSSSRYKQGNGLSSSQWRPGPNLPCESVVKGSCGPEIRLSTAESTSHLRNLHLYGDSNQSAYPEINIGFRAGLGVSPSKTTRSQSLSLAVNEERHSLHTGERLLPNPHSAPTKAWLDFQVKAGPGHPSDLISNIPHNLGMAPGLASQIAPLQSNFTEARLPNLTRGQTPSHVEMRLPLPDRLRHDVSRELRPGITGQFRPAGTVDVRLPVSNPMPSYVSEERFTLPHRYVVAGTSLPSSNKNSFEKPGDPSQQIFDIYKSSLSKVFKAIERLRKDMMTPTETNLQDCIQYWDRELDNFNLKQTLERAVDQGEFEILTVGAGGFRMFVPCNSQLWSCVDAGNMQSDYPRELWSDFGKFLLYKEEWQLLATSQSWYAAAQMLKNRGPDGLRSLAVGNLVNLLQQAVHRKKWLKIHVSGWPLLSLNIEAVLGLPY